MVITPFYSWTKGGKLPLYPSHTLAGSHSSGGRGISSRAAEAGSPFAPEMAAPPCHGGAVTHWEAVCWGTISKGPKGLLFGIQDAPGKKNLGSQILQQTQKGRRGLRDSQWWVGGKKISYFWQ